MSSLSLHSAEEVILWFWLSDFGRQILNLTQTWRPRTSVFSTKDDGRFSSVSSLQQISTPLSPWTYMQGNKFSTNHDADEFEAKNLEFAIDFEPGGHAYWFVIDWYTRLQKSILVKAHLSWALMTISDSFSCYVSTFCLVKWADW